MKREVGIFFERNLNPSDKIASNLRSASNIQRRSKESQTAALFYHRFRYRMYQSGGTLPYPTLPRSIGVAVFSLLSRRYCRDYTLGLEKQGHRLWRKFISKFYTYREGGFRWYGMVWYEIDGKKYSLLNEIGSRKVLTMREVRSPSPLFRAQVPR